MAFGAEHAGPADCGASGLLDVSEPEMNKGEGGA
jgi:hypothetical protein